MFIELDLTLNGERSVRMINCALVEEIIVGKDNFLILFIGGEAANSISYRITPDTRAFFEKVYESLKAFLIYTKPELNGVNVIRI